jgi:alkyldihydroxyacetonephosphate synthase
MVQEQPQRLSSRFAAILPGTDLTVHEPPSVESLGLPEPRVAVPDSLIGLVSRVPADRAAHAHGQAFRDVVRNLMDDVRNPPDQRPDPFANALRAAKSALDPAGILNPGVLV